MKERSDKRKYFFHFTNLNDGAALRSLVF